MNASHVADWFVRHTTDHEKQNYSRVQQGGPHLEARPAGPGRLLSDVKRFVCRFVAFPTDAQAVAAALWIVHAHLIECFESSPRLALLSPEAGSGKTRTLEVIELLVPRPLLALNASAAAIFRTIETARPTLLLDEVDAIFTHHGKDDSAEDLRALLNAGHRKGATIPRCVGPRHEVQLFPVYAPVALAGLGDLPETLMSRSVIVRLRKRAPDEQVEAFRRRVVAPDGERLRERIADWADTVRDTVGDAWPTMPEGVTDRPADCWEPLLAIADATGGHWPNTARWACQELCKVAANREASLGVKLLADLRDIFGDDDRLATATVLDRLVKLDESPWADLRGRPLDARGLARRLRSYEITSRKVKIDGKAYQGYQREDLHDAWSRYLSLVPGNGEPAEPKEPATSKTAHEVSFVAEVPELEPGAEPEPGIVTSIVPQAPEVPSLPEPGTHDDVDNNPDHDAHDRARGRAPDSFE